MIVFNRPIMSEHQPLPGPLDGLLITLSEPTPSCSPSITGPLF